MEEQKTEIINCSVEQCNAALLPVKDALEVLNGRWRLPILITLSEGPKRFKQIAKEVVGITDKMLSKELKSLEENKLLTRKVYDTFPPMVEYAPTAHSETLKDVIIALKDWGTLHRREVIGK